MNLNHLDKSYTQTIIPLMTTTTDDMDGDIPQPWIFEAFNATGLSQTEIGVRIGESPQTINNWIARGRVPASKWRKIAVFLGKSMDWVAWGTEKRTKTLVGASGPALDAIIAAAGYDPERLKALWVKIEALRPSVASMDPEQKADLLLLVADTNGENIDADLLTRLIRRLRIRPL